MTVTNSNIFQLIEQLCDYIYGEDRVNNLRLQEEILVCVMKKDNMDPIFYQNLMYAINEINQSQLKLMNLKMKRNLDQFCNNPVPFAEGDDLGWEELDEMSEKKAV